MENSGLQCTGINQTLDFRSSEFRSLTDALEYAARGETGANFYNGRAELEHVLSYRDLRDQAQALAQRLDSLGFPRGARVAVAAQSDPSFHLIFFACQYAGLAPIALPAEVQLGGHDAYVGQLRQMLQSCEASLVIAPESHMSFIREAAAALPELRVGLLEEFTALDPSERKLQPLADDELAYLQFTSGSTRFPRAVEISQSAVLKNLQEIAEHGLRLDANDRFVSWLPFYHDMGLVGFVLLPMACQLSVDFLSPRSFAMRPLVWLKLLSENGGTISSSPPFGYAICAKRLRNSDRSKYDLRRWRAACVGAERIHPKLLTDFAQALEPAGFDPKSFVACYGMAECSLAVSFAPLATGIEIDVVSKQHMANELLAHPLPGTPWEDPEALVFVDCGEVLPSFELSINDEHGEEVADRRCGRVCLRGPSVMRGYFQDPEASAETLNEAGWLDTGDIGYRVGDRLFLTARSKDVIIVNGRNIWPQDLEFLADGLPGVRQGNASAFATESPWGEDVAVLVVEYRNSDVEKQQALARALAAEVRAHFGVNAYVDLVPPGTLPRTSSGKLARSRTKADFLTRMSTGVSSWTAFNAATESAARGNARAVG